MTKARLLNLMRTERARWEDALAQVPSEQMTRSGIEGEWSAKDVVAHISQYDRGLLDWLREAVPATLDSE
jgi:hypothetical protein